jgi:hypothetical protein
MHPDEPTNTSTLTLHFTVNSLLQKTIEPSQVVIIASKKRRRVEFNQEDDVCEAGKGHKKLKRSNSSESEDEVITLKNE